MKRRCGDHWKQELAKRPTKRQIAALDALHRGSKPQTKDEPRGNFFDELADDLARD